MTFTWWSSTRSTLSTREKLGEALGVSMPRWRLKHTSSTVSRSPLWNFTSSRILKVYSRPSAETSQDSAMQGWAVKCSSIRTRVS